MLTSILTMASADKPNAIASRPTTTVDHRCRSARSVVAFLFFSMLALSVTSSCSEAVEPSSVPLRLMELKLGTAIERGLPIAWDARQVKLLRVDGSIGEFEPNAIRSHQVLDEAFVPDSAIRMRGQLQREFGKRYAVEGSGNFAIIAPTETVHLWTQRFSQLDRTFQNYFSTRGFQLRPAEFPLVGIVFPSEQEFMQYANRNGNKLQAGTVGYYSILTNRLYLYEMHGNPEAEREALMTVWHEATHQLAFNRGIHQRLSDPPLWMPEGIASIFEAPGMMSQRATMIPADLINASRWGHWKKLAESPEKTASLLDSMIRDDRLFRSQPSDAYAIAWGVSLYLAERDTKHYVQYLRQLAKLAPGADYPEASRIRDFHQAFNTSSILIIKAADRFLQSL